MKKIIFIFLVLLCVSLKSAIIDPTNMVPWIPDVTVGVRGGIPAARTNLINVTLSPYFADNTGATSAASAIQSAISAATSGQVIYCPAGIYDITSGITINKNNVTLRGAGTNTILVGNVALSQDPNGNYPNNYGIGIASGAIKGATSMVLNSNVDLSGTSIIVGDAFNVTTLSVGNQLSQFFSTSYYNYTLRQPVLVTNVSGNTIGFTPPLVWDFTNTALVQPLNLVGFVGLQMISGVGLENFTLTTSNGVLNSTAVFMLKMEMCHDCWVTNCQLYWGQNYNVFFEYNIHCTFAHNSVRFSKGSGSNHSGIVAATDSGCLIEDNIMADGLQPALEWNDGFCGNVVFGNFLTNNLLNFDAHNSHPIMNLFEENVTDSFQMDGYFGSASHHTVFRNVIVNSTVLKRFTFNIQVVGNVLGRSTYPFTYFPNYPTTYGLFEVGYPNIGNNGFTGTSGPTAWNYPGNSMTGWFGEVLTNGMFVFTNTQVGVTNISGNFSNVPDALAYSYYLIGQDASNTNLYHYIGSPVSGGTSSNIIVSTATTVSNGWRVFLSNALGYQQIQTSNLLTDTLTGNAVYTNGESTTKMVWDANGVQAMPNSYLYTNGAPSWWGAVRWPAIDVNSSPQVTSIPAQLRYAGTIDTNIYVAITAVNCTVNNSTGSVSVPTNSVATVATNAANFLNYSITGGSLSNANAAVTFLTASNAMTVTGNYSAPMPPAGNVTTVGRIYF